MKNVVNAARRFASSTSAKVSAGASTLLASGAAFASGTGSPGAAVAGELASGKGDVMLVIGACAIILGAIILWAYVKRAR
ncbi:hypothetical protein [Xanthomonas campestris]|uniref:hypothetical protein n=1 Tax=Xanthomonas campestris TaxID=339 RepID=UPI002B224FD3|nr:hypothetical protein [Xanthomonas campestris]MEA9732498.1 hypothetical protein [Xanthomonas campestris]